MADSSVTFTRPADTTAYTANDVVGATLAALEFVAMGRNGVIITSAELEVDAAAVIASEASYTLHLYNVTPPSALADNAPHDLPSGDRASYLGSIVLGTPVDIGSTLYLGTDGYNKQVTLLGSSIFAYLVTAAGFTPTASRVYKITMHTVEV